MALFIPAEPTEAVREVLPGNGNAFTFEELYELLACDLVETRRLADESIMVLDEEGKFADKPRNARATGLADFATPAQMLADMQAEREHGVPVIWAGEPITAETTEVDYIAGDVLICSSQEWGRVGFAGGPTEES
jgi:hypothetical protein